MARPAGSGDSSELIYGVHAVREALRAATRPLLKVVVSQEDRRLADVVKLARQADVPVHLEPRAALDRLVPSGKHQGIVAVAAAKAYDELDAVVARARQGPGEPLLVVLDGIEDPHNLGAVIRTAEAAGAHGVVIPERRAVGLTATVAKASAGAVDHLPIACAGNLNRTIEALKESEVWIYGFESDAPTVYTDLDYQRAVALIFGGEGRGMRPSVRSKCDAVARLPMHGRVSSLNVSAAAAAVLFEAVRQRAAGQGRPRVSAAE
jgi:23S rRNA (guanosine2251-2'-O)-methyltransferase